jgi:hypothetical protein
VIFSFRFYGKMGCGCGKKRGPAVIYDEKANATGDPKQWGPALWSVLHILAAHVGNQEMDIDQARDFDVIIGHLCQVLPCATCQAHCKTYIAANPFEAAKNAKVAGDLAKYVQTWLLNFHNAVRTQNGQSIDITTLEQLTDLYAAEKVQQCQLTIIVMNARYGIQQRLIKTDTWKRWYTVLNHLKVISLS